MDMVMTITRSCDDVATVMESISPPHPGIPALMAVCSVHYYDSV